jgi:hypothetical protein
MVNDLEALSKALTAGAAVYDKAQEKELTDLIMKDRERIEEELNRDGQTIVTFRGCPYRVDPKSLTP